MTVDKSKIMDAMAGKIQPEELEQIAGILCRTPDEYPPVSIIEDAEKAAIKPEDNTWIAPCRPAKHPRPRMIELPPWLLNGPWIRKSLHERFERLDTNGFYASVGDLGWAASEPIYLAILLREVYGPDGLRDLVNAVVFAQPAYGAFKSDVEPILEKYIY